MESAIELVHIDEYGRCNLNKNATEIIEKIDAPISAITIAGPYRTGKSYLLNRFIGKQDGFKIGSTTQPMTRGIWMWSKPQKNNNGYTILLDTEGFGSGNRDDKTDSKIFAIAILFSSVFIYNVNHAINEKALEYLGMILNLAQYIHIKSKNAKVTENLEDYSQFFPFFLWVIRDFALKLESTERQYMESALRPTEGTDESTMTKNDIRQAISDYFKERDCVTLPRPCNEEADIGNISQLAYEKLRQKFRDQIEKLISKVYTRIKPKCINNVILNGRMYISMVRSYISSLNSDSVPTIMDTWSQIVETECKSLFNSAQYLYEEEKRKLEAELPLEEKELRGRLSKIRMHSFDTIFKADLQANEIYNKYFQKMQEHLSQAEEDVFQTNYKKSEMHSIKLLDEAIAVFNSQKVENYSVTYVIENISILRAHYINLAKGPAKHEIYFKKMDEFQFSIIKKLLDSDSDKSLKEIQKLKTDLAHERGMNKAQTDNIELLKKAGTEKAGISEDKYKAEMEKYKSTIEQMNKDYAELSKMAKDSGGMKITSSDIGKKVKLNASEALQVLYEKVVSLKNSASISHSTLNFEEAKRKLIEENAQNVYNAKKEELEKYRIQLNDFKLDMKIKEGKLSERIDMLEKDNLEYKRTIATMSTKIEMLNNQLKIFQSQNDERESMLSSLKKLTQVASEYVNSTKE